jgi:uncharacterized protein YdaT
MVELTLKIDTSAIQPTIDAAKAEMETFYSELEFLRFFHKTATEWYSNGSTDEEFWIKEMYEETGNTVPEEYY